MYNLKKYTQKDRYGNTITFEVERMQEATVPSMQEIPMYDHPGDPRGTDTVPAWLTPGEFVMNAEATRMYEPQIKAMNDHGRAVQKAQGGTIPQYAADGGWISNLFLSDDVKDAVASAQAPNQYQQSRTAEILRDAPPSKPYMDPEGAREREIAAENARAGAEKIAPNIPVVGPMADYLIQRRKHYEQLENLIHRSSGGDVPPLDMMVNQVLQHEGGYADVSGDRGGRTNYGITQSTWGDRGDVKDITKDQARGFYKDLYNQSRINRFPEELRPQIFDMVVNHGYGNAMKIVQGAAGVDRDGKVGPTTLKAVGDISKGDLVDSRLDFYNNIVKNDPSQEKFLKGWTNRAVAYRKNGSEEPEVPMMEEVPMPVDGIVQDMAGFQESNPNPPAPELVPTLDSGLLAMDPSNEDYPPSYEGDNYLYNTNDEVYDRQMNAQLNKMSDLFEDNPRVIGKDGSPQEFSEEEMQAQRIATIPEGGDEFGDIGQETEFTDRDKEKVQEGRERRYKEERDRQNAKRLNGQEISEAEEKRLSELDMIRKGEIPQDRVNIDPDAPGEDMNVTYEMEAVKSFADKYGEPTDEEFNKIDKQFEDLNKQEKDSSWLDSLVSKDMQSSIGGFFSKMMGHALSDRALSSLVLNYVGSRAMGYDHGSSFQFAAKKYGKQIEASQALEDKLYLSGKYKAPSIKRAMEKGDFGELVLAKSGATTDGTFKDYYKNGKKYRAQKFKVGDNVIYYAIDPETKQRVPIDNTFHEDGRLVKGTNEYRKMIGESKASIAKMYEQLETRIGKIDGGDDPDKFKLGSGPEMLSDRFVNWALRKGFDPQDSRTTAIIGNAYRQAVSDLDSGKIKSITNLDSYLDRQHLYETTGSVDLFTTNLDKVQSNESAPKLVPGHLMQSLYNNVTNAASLINTDSTGKKVPIESARQAMFSHAMKEWKNLEEKNPAEFNKYVESADKDRTAFYNYFTDNLNNLMKSYAGANK